MPPVSSSWSSLPAASSPVKHLSRLLGRELIEETGFRARKWSRLVRYYASPGFLAETMQVFLAEDIRAGKAQPEPDEKIELLHLPLSDLLAKIHAGQILDGKTILSILLFSQSKFRRS